MRCHVTEVRVLRDSIGENGLEGEGGRYSCMLEIRYNDEDSKNNVKCLRIRRRFPMLNIRYNDEDTKNNVVSLLTFLDPPPFWKNNAVSLIYFLDLCGVTITPILLDDKCVKHDNNPIIVVVLKSENNP